MRLFTAALLALLASSTAQAQKPFAATQPCSVEVPAGVQEVLNRQCADVACYERQVLELKMMVMTFSVTSETYKQVIDALTSRPANPTGPATDL